MSITIDEFRQFFAKRMENKEENHFNLLGFTNLQLDYGTAKMEMPYNELLIGNPDTGIVADGAMMALLDTCCALASATVKENISFSPTLDLRVDHMGLPEANLPLICEAEVYRHTDTVIFTRCSVHQGDTKRPVARALVNFTPIDKPIIDTSPDNVKRVVEHGGQA
ncbi:PaaI family thioesterase [Aurantivibrio plasticivorans]